MTHRLLQLLLAGLLMSAVPALADRRALSLDVTPGWSAGAVPAPGALLPSTTLSLGPSLWLGTRYALTNALELSVTGFFDTPVTVAHNAITLRTDSGDFGGSLMHQTLRFGAQGGVHAVFGRIWRLHLGLELGWSQRSFTGFQMLDDSNPTAPIDYGLALPNKSQGSFVVAPLLGLEWAIGDHWSLALMPRAQLMLGPQFAWSVILPLQFSYSWYL